MGIVIHVQMELTMAEAECRALSNGGGRFLAPLRSAASNWPSEVVRSLPRSAPCFAWDTRHRYKAWSRVKFVFIPVDRSLTT